MSAKRIESVEELLDRIGKAADDAEKVSFGRVLEYVGRRSFGPILLFAGLITLSPIGGIPAIPSLMAVLVFAVAVQLLMRRRHFWLPSWLLNRKLSRDKLKKTLEWSRKPARWLDRVLKPRMTYFTHNRGAYFMAAVCLLVAAGMPPMEFVPFSVTIAGLVLTLFGLALIAHDGLLALIGLVFAASAYGLLLFKLLG